MVARDRSTSHLTVVRTPVSSAGLAAGVEERPASARPSARGEPSTPPAEGRCPCPCSVDFPDDAA